MKNLKIKHKKYIWKTVILPILIFSVLLICLAAGVWKFEQISTEQNLQLTLSAIRKATVQCYANEGRYPSSLQYLEEEYNVSVDHEKFSVIYDCAASNIMPNILVFGKGEEWEGKLPKTAQGG